MYLVTPAPIRIMIIEAWNVSNAHFFCSIIRNCRMLYIRQAPNKTSNNSNHRALKTTLYLYLIIVFFRLCDILSKARQRFVKVGYVCIFTCIKREFFESIIYQYVVILNSRITLIDCYSHQLQKVYFKSCESLWIFIFRFVQTLCTWNMYIC